MTPLDDGENVSPDVAKMVDDNFEKLLWKDTPQEEQLTRIIIEFANYVADKPGLTHANAVDTHKRLKDLIEQEKLELLDRVENSVTQHTVPEGKHLITRSYVQNTLDFERATLKKQQGTLE